MLLEGHELGNHSFDHAVLAGAGPQAVNELRTTNAGVRAATRFAPCVFRPPYGAVSDALIATAHREGLATVGWDVDPQDWSLPGAVAIQDRVVGALHAGAIILLHDGPAAREQTVAALPSILRTIQARGYELVTVSELLGFPPLVR
jgi:peptidoglycan/xylan/chitin deacetylase (PgdA/CDA1 family)